MTIQTHRETIARNSAAFNVSDPSFAKSVNDRYNALKAKSANPHPSDLRRLSADVSNWVHAEIAKPGALNGSSSDAIDAATGWCHLLSAEIDLIASASHAGFNASGVETGWKDAATGAPVRILAPNEPIASGVRPSATVGAILNGLLNGAKTPEIKAALSEGTDAAGGFSIPTEVLGQFFDKLRAKTQFIQAGAQTLMLEGLKTRIMRVSADAVPAWRMENAAVGESQPTFDKVDFLPQSLAVLVKVSAELLADSVNAEQALEASLIGALAVELDRVCLFGSGTAPEPRGLFNTTGINSVSMGTNGLTPANYDAFIDALYSMEAANGGPATAAIMHPRTARTLRKLKDSTNQPLRLPPYIESLPMLTSTSVPITQTQGTSTGVSSTTLVGNWAMAILGLRQSLVIQRLDQTFAGNLQIGFIASLRADVGFAHPESFTAITGVLQ